MIRFAVRPPEDETPPTDRIIGTTRSDIVWSGFFLAYICDMKATLTRHQHAKRCQY